MPRVDVDLTGNALELILQEQKKRFHKTGRTIGKERLINILLAELYEIKIKDSIVPPTPLSKDQWNKFLKKK